jgi:hypothetical protein
LSRYKVFGYGILKRNNLGNRNASEQTPIYSVSLAADLDKEQASLMEARAEKRIAEEMKMADKQN